MKLSILSTFAALLGATAAAAYAPDAPAPRLAPPAQAGMELAQNLAQGDLPFWLRALASGGQKAEGKNTKRLGADDADDADDDDDDDDGDDDDDDDDDGDDA